MLKFYILISQNPGVLWRHFSPDYSALPKDQTEVIINTTSKQEERDLVQFCNDFDISYTVTKSNGTPGKGKNSVLEIFSKSSHDYCVQIDGDDLLTPHGVELYQQITELETVPDVVCLKNQVALTPALDPSKKEFVARPFFTSTYNSVDWEKEYETLKEFSDPEKALEVLNYKKNFHRLADKYIEENETHCRVVFLSKKAAKYKFDEDIKIGEDTLHYYRLKDAHMKSKLIMFCNDERPASYIYCQNSESILQTVSIGFSNADWMEDFITRVLDMEKKGELWECELPLLKINYKSIPCMDDYDLKGPPAYIKDNYMLDLPANATMSSAKRLWQDYKIPMKNNP